MIIQLNGILGYVGDQIRVRTEYSLPSKLIFGVPANKAKIGHYYSYEEKSRFVEQMPEVDFRAAFVGLQAIQRRVGDQYFLHLPTSQCYKLPDYME